MGQTKLDDAIAYFKKALALNPMLLDAHYNMATSYLLAGNRKQAKDEFGIVLQQKPFDMATLFHLGTLSENSGDYKSAGAYYARMLSIDPQDRAALRNLALLHCRIGGVAMCRRELRFFLDGAPPGEPDEDIRRFLAL